ncbi:hypothetical protein MesoLjLc_14920 [Mesorhizobium sp. L-8-10]|uniref:hypothetical protein n=1 Tax=unclassified Mesorhizobium TaxID=325217 RepID=UPI00192792A9|nr:MULTISPECIES: hypothetical protein [unclassified Mesorhizobium]BCH21869.1 hypothetical protein MesoLjLb_16540 [Mesorhizobium sp. L-8-3]BCH29562.1 hypothetical protein MesoLjLc_14920 [Mesorhizobium sp. L-8-10]
MARFSLTRWIGFAVAVAVVSPSAAHAQVICLDRTALVDSLSARLHQRQFGYGIVSDTVVVELYTAPDGSWTVVMTDVSGRACILAIGQGWQTTLPAPGDDA